MAGAPGRVTGRRWRYAARPSSPVSLRALRDARHRTVAKAAGRTLDLGGIETNIALYPPAVTALTALEPNRWSRRRVDRAIAWSDGGIGAITFVENLTALASTTGPFDTIVSVTAIGGAAQPKRMIDTVERLLAPHGTLVFAERGTGWRTDPTTTMMIGSGRLFISDIDREGTAHQRLAIGTARHRPT